MLQLTDTSEQLKELEAKYKLSETIEFINHCLSRYDFPAAAKKNIVANLNIIANKRKNNYFYLGVIGEASSGKSTLINALLNYDLLVTNVQLGTTTASTFIYGATNFGIDLYFDNDEGDLLSYPKDKNILSVYGYKEGKTDAENVKAILAYATAQEWVSKNLKRVEVRLPIPMLQSGLVIVDTPGINAPNERHFVLTAETVETMCDTAIVVIPSHTPFSEALNNFLTEYLNPYLHRCIYVLSMIDQASQNGRQQLKDVVYQRLCHMLNVENPILLPVSTVPSMEGLGTSVVDISAFQQEELEEFKAGFQTLITTTQHVLSTQRVHIVLERILNTCKLLIAEISKQLDALEGNYQKEHQALLDAVLERPKASADSMLQKALTTFRTECNDIKSDLKIRLRKREKSLYNDAEQVVNSMNSKKNLQDDLKNRLESVFQNNGNAIQEDIENHSQRIGDVIESSLSSFSDRFNTIYNTLATLGGTINPVSPTIKSDGEGHTYAYSTKSTIGSAISTAKSAIEEGEESTAAGFWIGLGAAMLIPGLGLIIGPAIGATLGHLFGPSLDTVKDKVRSELKRNIKESYKKLRRRAIIEFDESTEYHERIIAEEVERSFTNYNQLVDKMNKRDAKLKDEMKTKHQIVSNDRELTNELAIQIKSALADLKKV